MFAQTVRRRCAPKSWSGSQRTSLPVAPLACPCSTSMLLTSITRMQCGRNLPLPGGVPIPLASWMKRRQELRSASTPNLFTCLRKTALTRRLRVYRLPMRLMMLLFQRSLLRLCVTQAVLPSNATALWFLPARRL